MTVTSANEHVVAVDDDRRMVVEEQHDLDEPVEVVRKRSFSIGQLLAIIAGAALVALGIAALVQTGVDTPLSEPVEPVLGWDHTPMLGIIEIAAGALSSCSPSAPVVAGSSPWSVPH